jgi:hypothetical protein
MSSLIPYIVESNVGPHFYDAEDASDALAQHLAEHADAPAGYRVVHNVLVSNVEHRARPVVGEYAGLRTLPVAVRDTLVEATKAANLQRCAFVQDETVQVEDVRRYLDTWVVGRLRCILRWDNGEVPHNRLRGV